MKKPDVFTVSRLNQEARKLLESGFGTIWLEAELSNLSIHSSGHWYFSLKDDRAAVRGVMFYSANSRLPFLPKEGDHLLVKAKLSLYEPRGDYQLILEELSLAGSGALGRALELLKAKLLKEGLFDEKYKKKLPARPCQIGIITSPTGAALHDILSILKKRFSSIPIIIYPSIVQGATASFSIVEAIETVNRRAECDVIILARGGGSFEDLSPFNEERVVRAIYQSVVPIVTGVGHETDFSLADLAADHRAPTPSAAAVHVVPDQQDLQRYIVQLYNRFNQKIRQSLKEAAHRLEVLKKSLVHPRYRIQEFIQRLDYLQIHLHQTMRAILKQFQQNLTLLMHRLQAYSPLTTLERGYALASKEKKVVTDIDQILLCDTLNIQIRGGNFDCRVIAVHKE